MKTLSWFVLCLMLAACGIAQSEDYAATVEAGDVAYVTEAARLRLAEAAYGTDVAATVSVMETDAAQIEVINARLYSTLVAVVTPTPGLVVGRADASSSGMGDMVEMEEGQFLLTGITDQVDGQTGCVLNPRETFDTNVNQLFVTIQAYDSVAGTPMRAEWSYEGQLRVQQDWQIDQSAPDRCLWFRLDRTDTDFTPGAWSVSVYTGEGYVMLSAPLTFELVGS